MTDLEKWPKRLIGAYGLSLAGLLAFVFFLGSLYTKVSETSDKVDKLYGVVAIDKDSLLSRTSAIETRMGALEVRVSEIEGRLTSIESTLTSMDTKLTELTRFRGRSSVPRETHDNR